jgi:hypothetical protein
MLSLVLLQLLVVLVMMVLTLLHPPKRLALGVIFLAPQLGRPLMAVVVVEDVVLLVAVVVVVVATRLPVLLAVEQALAADLREQ